MLTILVKMILLCSVILTRLTAVVDLRTATKLESGTIPMELKWKLRNCLHMNFTEAEDHKLYASIINKAHLLKEDFSDVKYQIPAA